MTGAPRPAEEGGRPTGKTVDLMAALKASLRGEDPVAASVVSSEEGGRAATVDGKLAEPDAIATFLSVVEFAVERRSPGVSLTIEQARELAADIQSRQWRVPPASVVGDASEGEADDVDVRELLDDVSRHFRHCGDPNADTSDDEGYILESIAKIAASLHSTRAALADAEALSAAMKREFTEYRDEQDTRLREAQKDARLARAALEEARKNAERTREALQKISEGRGTFSMDQQTFANNVIAEAIATAKEALAAIPSQESTTE